MFGEVCACVSSFLVAPGIVTVLLRNDRYYNNESAIKILVCSMKDELYIFVLFLYSFA